MVRRGGPNNKDPTAFPDRAITHMALAQAKSQFAALVARSEAGERIVVTRSRQAVACLGPLPGRHPIYICLRQQRLALAPIMGNRRKVPHAERKAGEARHH